ncbi:DUF998 domain-containing protein [Methanocella sp. CWC-04]|uniref:DUF998 domain-containing protein n=1 Tax=Methanooceanicella nereidis TaxID=2052831 RepID=A0AAP2RCG9_9EURY|nr:DUF998 domain-containing protein [Methanocella sp. CWC-04]MCD1293530.1 DUF998 domain-containing protein [Methanocella sp. CWC-04]
MKDNKADSRKIGLTIAGLLFFLAGSIALMGIITAEIFYPEVYTTSNNMISDLGATEPPNSKIYQPSATIFNMTMILAGIMVLTGTYFLSREYKDWVAILPIGLFGLGVLGVGIFPGNVNPQHPLFAMAAFIGGGLSAICSYRIIKSPFKFAAVLFGLITLVFLFTTGITMPVLGGGGTERWVAYPVILWLIGFGGYLLGAAEQRKAA